MKKEQEEIKKICKEFSIDLKNRRLPYKEKIRQICNNLSAFYRYKWDQRLVLDHSLIKSPEYKLNKEEEFENEKA